MLCRLLESYWFRLILNYMGQNRSKFFYAVLTWVWSGRYPNQKKLKYTNTLIPPSNYHFLSMHMVVMFSYNLKTQLFDLKTLFWDSVGIEF